MIKGSHQSLEAIEKIRLAGIGRKHSVEAKLKISKSHRLENLSMQTRLNKSNSKKGNKNPDVRPSILESELQNSKSIEINAESLPVPTSIEQLQSNYLLFEERGLDINFR